MINDKEKIVIGDTTEDKQPHRPFDAARFSRIFKAETALSEAFVPSALPFRENQINTLVEDITFALFTSPKHNIFCFGPPGTGKTSSVLFTLAKVSEIANQNNKTFIYITITPGDFSSEANIYAAVGNTVYEQIRTRTSAPGRERSRPLIPRLGLSAGETLTRMKELLDGLKNATIALYIEEFDRFYSKLGSDFLYTLTRMEFKNNTKLLFVGVCNNIAFIDTLPSSVKSTLKAGEMHYPPYNAAELAQILTQRVSMAFQDNVVDMSAIQMAAALTAQHTGDARYGIELLHTSGKLAYERGAPHITTELIKEADRLKNRDRFEMIIKTLPLQQKITLAALYKLSGEAEIGTNVAFDAYIRSCLLTHANPNSSRAFTTYLQELAKYGFISEIVRKGQGRAKGVTATVSFTAPLPSIRNGLEADSLIKEVLDARLPKIQQKL
jgi:cell division control protein 6